MPLRAADFESAAYAIPPLRASPSVGGVGERSAATCDGPSPLVARHHVAKTQRPGALGGESASLCAPEVPVGVELSVTDAEPARVPVMHPA